MVRTLITVLMVAGMMATGTAVPGAATGHEQGRTWVVDAVDDAWGSRWVSADTGTSEVTIEVGDTVEWQFDVGTAAIEHDLTSQNTSSHWHTPVTEYRAPGDPPVRHTFTEPGIYDYLCSIHGTVMRGTVRFEDGAGGDAPVVTAAADPTTGPAPLSVHFAGHAADQQGGDLTYTWDFGVQGTGDVAHSAEAAYTYADPGIYTATLSVADGKGNVGTDTVGIVAGGGAQMLPESTATATPSSGEGPLEVAFSTEVSTSGTVGAFADGLATYPDLAGPAELLRARGETHASLEVTGLKPGAAHMVHVHEQPCSRQNGGAHFRFDDAQPFGEQNEIWLPFTSDAEGHSRLVEVTQPQRAGAKAVSIVVHDPDNPAHRIGCADLAPSTAELTYAWDFGDGDTGLGADPDHTYTDAGTYTATVTVSRTHADAGTGHDHRSTTDSVEVVVEDTSRPVIRDPRPEGTTRDRTPAVRATVRDRLSPVRGKSVVLRVDGRVRSAARYHSRRDLVTWTPKRRLAPGRHTVRLAAADAVGNRAVRTWRFRIRR